MSSISAALLTIGLIGFGGYFLLKYAVFEGESFRDIFKAFFPSKLTPSILTTKVDRDFGKIQYYKPSTAEDFGYWQMGDNWKDSRLSSASIPGDINGPYDKERVFILGKFESASSIFDTFKSDLIPIVKNFYPKINDENVGDVFFISCINTDEILDESSEWEVCFEANKPHKWSYISLQIQGETVVSKTVDT